ncbi:4'-phosphopantetheinyl transferase family protein [Rhizobium leguminosarum]|uniref:4'-phosphopantetheinyl transferase family protein n=1 Tax=Rhizobium TaxID=379 RepID=UPI0013EEDCB2|nr:4'-phosphopantetheinyl transferase superfamily protein [Rhizobium leguminosarum]
MIEVWYWQMHDFLTSKHRYCLAEWFDRGERDRACSFRFELDRDRYVMAHILCRLALGNRLGLRPEALTFRRVAGRKPCLTNDSGVDFSISTTPRLAAVAVADGAIIGLDIECRQHVEMMQEVSTLILSDQERQDVEALNEPDRATRLLRLWTLKEAYLKAKGTGLAIPPNLVSFAFATETITCRDGTDDRHDFTFQTGTCLQAHFAIASRGLPASSARSFEFERGCFRKLNITTSAAPDERLPLV